MAVNSIAHPLPASEPAILIDRQCPDASDAAPGEIAGTAMVNRVTQTPVPVGSHGEDATNESESVIGSRRTEEGAVATIMLNDENSSEKSRSKKCNGQGQTIAHLQAVVN